MTPAEVDLSVSFAGVPLRNPVLAASGTFGYGLELEPFFDLRRLGGFVAKSLTLEPRHGNPPPRIAEVAAGMLNSISLENVGVDAFVREKLPRIPEGVPVFASVFGTEIDLYAEVCKRLTGVPKVVALEINASCPHVKAGGIEFGQDPAVLASLVRATRRASSLPARGEALAERHPHRRDGAGVRGGGRRRHRPHQRRPGLRRRPRDPAPGALERARRPLGPRDPARSRSAWSGSARGRCGSRSAGSAASRAPPTP